MKNKRKIFTSALRQCRCEQDRHEANALAAVLSSNNSGKLFWRKVNKSNKSTISAFVGGAKGSNEAITEIWRSHYSTLLNSVSKSSADNEFLLKQLQCGALFDDFSTFQCSVDVIGSLLRKLKLNCAAGTDNITAEHLCYCDDSIKFYLSVLFN